MAFLDFIFGRPAKRVERDLYNREQTNFLGNISGQVQELLPIGLQNLRNLLSNDQSTYEQYTQPLITDLNQRVIPEIAERFTGTYGPGSFNSSAFGQEIGSGIRNLGQDLSAARFDQQFRALQGIGSLLDLTKIPLQPTKGFYIRPRQQGLLDYIAGGIGGLFKQ